MNNRATEPMKNGKSSPKSSPKIDGNIVTSFQNSYVYKTFLTEDAITTVAKDGVVTLSGTVSEEAHRTLAEETVRRLPGVIRVENQLLTATEIAAENADTWIGRKVKLTLLFHSHVNAGGTTVEVKDRVVMLTGEATSMAQKELTTEYARDIEGVKEVQNKMTVAPPPQEAARTAKMKLDDASINAQVYTALLTHLSTSSMKTKIETRNGEVVLTGIARNAAEKALVTKIVTDIHGVTSVNNLMTVDQTATG